VGFNGVTQSGASEGRGPWLLVDAQRQLSAALDGAPPGSVERVLQANLERLGAAMGLTWLADWPSRRGGLEWSDGLASGIDWSSVVGRQGELCEAGGVVGWSEGDTYFLAASLSAQPGNERILVGASAVVPRMSTCFAFEAMARIISVARRQAESESELAGRVDLQLFLSSISSLAAVGSEAALDDILQRTCAYFGIGTTSLWRQIESGCELVAHSDPSMHGCEVQIPLVGDAMDQLLTAGHLTYPVGHFTDRADLAQPDSAGVLVVPLVGNNGGEGYFALADPGSRDWNEDDIYAAQSVARSCQKLMARRRAETVLEQRLRAETMLRDVASAAARAHADEQATLTDHFLATAIEHFGLTAASTWTTNSAGDQLVRQRGVRSDGRDVTAPARVSSQRLSVPDLLERGFAILDAPDIDELEQVRVGGEGLILLLPIGEPDGRFGALALVAPEGRSWHSGPVDDAIGLALVVRQTYARFAAEQLVQRRLVLEELSHRIAVLAVDARVDNVYDVLAQILDECCDFFGVSEAQIWRIEGPSALLRVARRRVGTAALPGLSVPIPAEPPVAARRSVFARLADFHPGEDVPLLDPLDSRLVINGYGGPSGLLGMLVLVDSSIRRWSADELRTLRSIADTIGQIRYRLLVRRELDRQREAEAIIAETAVAFVDASPAAIPSEVEKALGRLREHLGCSSVALFELDHDTLQLDCSSEVTHDGQPLQRNYAPLNRDDVAVARILDPTRGPEWTFSDLIGLPPGIDRTSLLIVDSVVGRDILLLSAANRLGQEFIAGQETVIRAMAGLLGQLRSRLLLEAEAELRSMADQLIGQIAADFVQLSLEDADEGIHQSLELICDMFGLRAAVLWKTDGDSKLHRRITAVGDGTLDIDLLPLTAEPDEWRQALGLHERGEVVTFSPGAAVGDSAFSNATFSFVGIGDPGSLAGGIGVINERPQHRVSNLDVLHSLLDAVGNLVKQLWRRLESDAEVGRRLAHEDMLRQFATRLAVADPSDKDPAEDTLGWLAHCLHLDHVSLWRTTFDKGVISGELRLEYGETADLRCLPDVRQVEAAVGDEPNRVVPESSWQSLVDADLPLVRLARETLGLERPRRVGFVADGDDSLMFFTRPGDAAFAEPVVSLLSSALTILTQHEAKAAAERAFTAAFSAAPVGISIRDSSLRLISCNAAYAELTGRTEAELKGTRLNVVMGPGQLSDSLDREVQPLDVDGKARESAYRHPDGTIVWARVRSTLVELPGRHDPVYFTYSEDITEQRRGRHLLEYQAAHDELTGLPNRRSLVSDVADELTRGVDCSVLILDLDRFKVVNDSLGHTAGDQLLIACADRIRLSLRPGDTVCRLGGDEFAILLRKPADAAAAALVADRLLRLLSEPVTLGDDEIFPSASIGIAIPEQGDTVEDLVRHADAAMYQAKAQGRDRWVHFDRSMRDAVVERIRTETDLRRAIDNGQLEVHFQPEFMLDTGQIVGAEALVRWRHPERGLLAAGSFISLAEETGLVVDLGRWVLGQATMQAAEWIRDGYDILVRVNLSARQLRAAIVGEVQQALAAAALAPERLCLELTETAIMDDVAESAKILQQFRELGVQVAIDDFGTGFSSLSYLKRFPVDILKIDRSFVDGVGVDPDDTAIVRSIIVLARTLRLDVVAEGIEDATQVDELVRLGCTRGQGFHLAKPAPAGDVTMLLGHCAVGET